MEHLSALTEDSKLGLIEIYDSARRARWSIPANFQFWLTVLTSVTDGKTVLFQNTVFVYSTVV